MIAFPNTINATVLGIILLYLLGCGSSRKSSPPTYNYSQYQTYRIGEPMVASSSNPVFKWGQLSERIHKALNFHLPSVGLGATQSNTDLLVFYYVIADAEAQRPVPSYQIGWRAEPFLASGERFSEYGPNTFVLDFVDVAADELVWRGSIRIPFGSEQQTYQQLSSQIQELVQRFPSLPSDS